MKAYPHHYRVEAATDSEGPVWLTAAGLPALESAPPEEFDGPGDRWSPETLLVGAVADCFVLTFRAVAKAAGLSWTRLRVGAAGTLGRADGGARFTAIELDAALEIPAGGSEERALRVLQKAERGCLVTRSLVCPSSLRAWVEIGGSI